METKGETESAILIHIVEVEIPLNIYVYVCMYTHIYAELVSHLTVLHFSFTSEISFRLFPLLVDRYDMKVGI